MFDTIYNSVSGVTASQFFIMAAASILSGFVFAWLISFKIRAKRRFFIVTAVVPFIVSAVITFVSGNIGAGVAVGGAFSLIRFRSYRLWYGIYCLRCDHPDRYGRTVSDPVAAADL